MFDKARSIFSSHRDASESVRQAEKFSVRLPVVGRVAVPPPDQLAFFGVLGVLTAVGVIEWPVAVTIGVGQVVVTRHFAAQQATEQPETGPELTAGDESTPAVAADEPPRRAIPATAEEVEDEPAKKAPSKKAAPSKAPAKKAPAKKTPAKKAAAKKTAAKKTAAKKTAAKKTAAKKSTPPKNDA